jgi:tripartite-type tricarboxylate transporter receptor subunit TctC
MKSLVVLLTCLIAAPVVAQSYPVKPIEMISPTSAGHGSDLVARVVADIIAKEKLLSQPIFIQNRAGGGGAVRQTYAASKRGDG